MPVKKKKLPSTRNPFVAHVKRRSATVIDSRDKEAKRDVWDRKAKHKDKNMTNKLDERVLGLTDMDSIHRIQELAGMKPVRQIKELDELDDDFMDIPMYDDGETSDIPDVMDTAPVPVEDDDVEDEVDADFGNVDDEIALPSPELPVDNYLDTVNSSPAFIEICNNIENIENKIADIKVSEFKELNSRLRSLYQTIRDSGFNYLQETRNYKK